MSVYYEAVQSGRLAHIGWHPTEVQHHAAGDSWQRSSYKGVRRALREAKNVEAEWRNADTPHERRRSHRREMEAALDRLTGKVVRRG